MQTVKNEVDRDIANFILQMFVATVVCGAVGYLCWTLTHVELKEKNNSAMLMILGGAIAWMGQLISFCFPNTIGSAKHQDTLQRTIDKIPGVKDDQPGTDKRNPLVTVEAGGPTTVSDNSLSGHSVSLGREGEQRVPRPDTLDRRGDQDQPELADGLHGVRNWQDVFPFSEEPRKFSDWPYPVHGGDGEEPGNEHGSAPADDGRGSNPVGV